MNMPKHDFGIMDIAPTLEQEYNKYEPEKFHCISAGDENIEALLIELSVIPCYWHSLKRRKRGLAYYGITLIPPRSLKEFVSAIDGKLQLNELKDLLQKADRENKFVIHFGI